jgi:hypothetical protein
MAINNSRKNTSSAVKSKQQNSLVNTEITSLAVVNPQAKSSPAIDLVAAKNSSELYFYRNKNKILEQDLARVQARLNRALQALGGASLPSASSAPDHQMNTLGSELLARDTLIGSLQQELARRDAMMRTLAFRVAWKYQRSPKVFRLAVRAAAAPVILPYLAYRTVKVKLLARRGDR